MKKLAGILSILVLVGFALAKGQIVLQGSTTVFPIAQRCAEEFKRLHPEVDISVRGGGSGVGIAGLIDGTCDIANASRPMKRMEIEEAKRRGFSPKGFVIAKDAIAVIVHRTNSLDEIALEDLKKIYTGQITNWKALGGPDLKIVVVSRDTASGTFEVFNKLVLKGARLTPRALYQASNKAVLLAVSKSKGAIGYIGLGYLTEEVKALKVEGAYPSKETVLKGTYPLQRPLFMYTRGEPTGLVKEFIEFVLSEEGQRIVEQVGFIPVR